MFETLGLTDLKMSSFGQQHGYIGQLETPHISTKQNQCMQADNKHGHHGLLTGLTKWQELNFSCLNLQGKTSTKRTLKNFVIMLWEFRSRQRVKLILLNGVRIDMPPTLLLYALE